ncbi:hypothetical protein Q4R98_18085, partial [Morganella morganii]
MTGHNSGNPGQYNPYCQKKSDGSFGEGDFHQYIPVQKVDPVTDGHLYHTPDGYLNSMPAP